MAPLQSIKRKEKCPMQMQRGRSVKVWYFTSVSKTYILILYKIWLNLNHVIQSTSMALKRQQNQHK